MLAATPNPTRPLSGPARRRAVAEELLPMVRALARRLAPPGADRRDLLGPGMLGVLRAVARHDGGAVAPATLAWHHARGAMLRSLRADAAVPPHRRATGVDLATIAGREANDRRDAAPDADRLLFAVGWHLTPRQAEVVRRRFGLEGRPAGTRGEVAAGLGITPRRVRQVEKEALGRLWAALGGAGEGVDRG